jgi:hypothetical protein
MKLPINEIRKPDNEFIRLFWDNIEANFLSALQKQKGKKELVELTESERFSIAVAAGAQIISHYGFRSCKEGCARSSPMIAHFETYYPCGICWDGEKFLVGEHKIRSFRNVNWYRP